MGSAGRQPRRDNADDGCASLLLRTMSNPTSNIEHSQHLTHYCTDCTDCLSAAWVKEAPHLTLGMPTTTIITNDSHHRRRIRSEHWSNSLQSNSTTPLHGASLKSHTRLSSSTVSTLSSARLQIPNPASSTGLNPRYVASSNCQTRWVWAPSCSR